MINLDDPAHQAERILVARRFTPLGACEAIEAIASRLPAMMTCDLLGYRRDMWERVRCRSSAAPSDGDRSP